MAVVTHNVLIANRRCSKTLSPEPRIEALFNILDKLIKTYLHTEKKREFLNMLEIIFSPVIFLFSLLIKKNNKTICIGSWFGEKYSDNSKYLYEEYLKYNPLGKNIRFIYKNKDLRDVIPQSGNCRGVYCYSLEGFYVQLRSKTFICSVGPRDFLFGVVTPINIFIQLFHGLSIKKIGFDAMQSSVDKFKFKLRRYTTDNYDYVLSPIDIFDDSFTSAFMIKKEQLIRCGYPRWDGLDGLSGTKKNDGSKTVVGYLPTHRSEGLDAVVIANILDEADESLTGEEDKIEFKFKPHFYDAPHFRKSKYVNIEIVSSNIDVYEFLNTVDVLITDYSSVAFDFLSTGKPIVFLAPDLESYKNEKRGLFFDYDYFVKRYYTDIGQIFRDVIGRQDLNGMEYIPIDDTNNSRNLISIIDDIVN